MAQHEFINPLPIVVPTDDRLVVKQLRASDEPAKYFAEGPAERRQRLARVLVGLTPELRAIVQEAIKSEPIGNQDENEAFYYEGNELLRKARYKIASYSVQQCSYRLDMARIRQLEPASNRLALQQDLIEKVRKIDDPETYVDEETSTGELKTFTSCSFNSDASLLCTSCRSGRCKLWSVPTMDTHCVLDGHQQSANHIVFSPKSGSHSDLSPMAANLASCSMDGSVALWSLVDSKPVTLLSGPQAWRVTRVRYHPSGDLLASCCSDKSWRLWSIEAHTEILHQEGHSDDVFDIAFHPDGSLAGSAGLDSYGRIWDLRTGRAIQLLSGHSKGIRTIDFSPDGYQIATGSLDNSVRVWDLRQRKVRYVLPAHTSVVTSVLFEKENGHYLTTASFDKTVKFWSTRTFAPIKILDAYEDKVAKIDLSADSKYLISCYSKYLKLWTSQIERSLGEDDTEMVAS